MSQKRLKRLMRCVEEKVKLVHRDIVHRINLKEGPFFVCDGVCEEEAKALLDCEQITRYGIQYDKGSLYICGDNTAFHSQAITWMMFAFNSQSKNFNNRNRVQCGTPHLILSSGVIKRVDAALFLDIKEDFVQPIVVGEAAFTNEDDETLRKNLLDALALESVNLVFGVSLGYNEVSHQGIYKFFVGCRSWGKDTIKTYNEPVKLMFPAEEVYKHPALEDLALQLQGNLFELDLDDFVGHMNACTRIYF